MPRTQPAFTLLEVVIVIALVVVLGGAALYETHKNASVPMAVATASATPTSAPAATASASPTPVPTASASPSLSPAPAATASASPSPSDEFAIPEIHAVITLPSGLSASDLKYSISTGTGVPMAYFTTSSLEQLDGTDNCSASHGPIGSIWRTTEAPPAGYQNTKKIGQYYYYFDGPSDTCSANQGVDQLETEQADKLQQAFGTIQATN